MPKRRCLPVIALIIALAACEKSPVDPVVVIPPGGEHQDTAQAPPDTVLAPPDTTPPPDTIPPADTTNSNVVITSVSALTPGKAAKLNGSGLASLVELSVDGQPVSFRVLSSDEVEFDVPVTNTCDVDQRPVEIIANGQTKHMGAIRVENAIRLEVGESKILSSEELSCLQLSGAVEDYLLSISSFSTDRIEERAMWLESVNVQPTLASNRQASVMPMGLGTGLELPQSVQEHLSPLMNMEGRLETSSFSTGEPFDHYATAQVGDTLQFVDWSNSDVFRAERREDVPTYSALVVAATPGQLVVADLREPETSKYLDPAMQLKFRKAAEIVDRVGLRAIEALINPNHEVPQGAGGRVVHIIQELPSGISGTVSVLDIQRVRWASNMYTTVLGDGLAVGTPGSIAGTMIHEMAHLADASEDHIHDRLPSFGWYMEALAVTVQDMATRMAIGVETQAPAWRLGDQGVPHSSIAAKASYSSDQHSPWGPPGSTVGATGPGSYDRGARILRYAQQVYGDTDFSNSGPTLHQRLLQKAMANPGDSFVELISRWGIDAIAEEIGMSAEELMEQSMLADLTDDLLPVGVVAQYNIPQLDGWDHSPKPESNYSPIPFGKTLDRRAAFATDVNLPAGGYAYWYIPGTGQGLSLQATQVKLQPHHRVRVTRLN